MTMLPIPPDLPDGWYRTEGDGRIETLRCTGGAWWNRFGVRVPAPAKYAPLDRRAA